MPDPRPPASPEDWPLSPRERAFVEHYLLDFNATEAAAAAGYQGSRETLPGKKGNALHVQACKVLKRPHVAAEIKRRLAERSARLNITGERCLRDIDTAANLDIAELCDERGNLLPLRQMPIHVRRCIVSVEVVKRNLTAGDGAMDTVLKVRLIDKARMHELLAKATGIVDGQAGEQPADVSVFALPPGTTGVSIH